MFDETYAENPLVNVLCLGVLPTDRLVLGQASGVGNLAVLLGSSTGRDGIGGVSVLASAGFSDEAADASKRPSVQVGDPYEEKRLIEACLGLLDAGLVVGIQDLGGAGLTCATSETASRGGVGMDVDVTAIPRREPGMEPFEVMTSESQERMLAIVEPGDLDEVLAICARWEVRADVIGRVTGGPGTDSAGRLRILDGWDGEVLADVPAASLHEDAPRYDRPMGAPDGWDEATRTLAGPPLPAAGADVGADLLDLLVDPSWVSSQYDHQLFLNTVEGPGGDATVLRLKHPVTGVDTGRGMALTTDGNHGWCAVDPRQGTALTVAESVLNLACVGARPVALVNCLNFGNPTHPEVMWQLSEAIDGMAEACLAFGIPVIGGNVSLYNESLGADIDPTPVIGMLGVVDRLDRRPPGVGLVPVVGCCWWARPSPSCPDRRGPGRATIAAAGSPSSTWATTPWWPTPSARWWPAVWWPGCTTSGSAVSAWPWPRWPFARASASRRRASTPRPALFSESPSRAMCVAPERLTAVLNVLTQRGLPVARIGAAGGDRLSIKDLLDVALVDAAEAWRRRLPRRPRGRNRPVLDRRRPTRLRPVTPPDDGPGRCGAAARPPASSSRSIWSIPTTTRRRRPAGSSACTPRARPWPT